MQIARPTNTSYGLSINNIIQITDISILNKILELKVYNNNDFNDIEKLIIKIIKKLIKKNNNYKQFIYDFYIHFKNNYNEKVKMNDIMTFNMSYAVTENKKELISEIQLIDAITNFARLYYNIESFNTCLLSILFFILIKKYLPNLKILNLQECSVLNYKMIFEPLNHYQSFYLGNLNPDYDLNKQIEFVRNYKEEELNIKNDNLQILPITILLVKYYNENFAIKISEHITNQNWNENSAYSLIAYDPSLKSKRVNENNLTNLRNKLSEIINNLSTFKDDIRPISLVEIDINNKLILIVNCHSKGILPNDILKKISDNYNNNIIMVGDFNTADKTQGKLVYN